MTRVESNRLKFIDTEDLPVKRERERKLITEIKEDEIKICSYEIKENVDKQVLEWEKTEKERNVGYLAFLNEAFVELKNNKTRLIKEKDEYINAFSAPGTNPIPLHSLPYYILSYTIRILSFLFYCTLTYLILSLFFLYFLLFEVSTALSKELRNEIVTSSSVSGK